MGRPFNYFQWEGTGQGAFIAPFATFFTGFYFPQDLQQGGAVGFSWHLADDDSLRPLTLRTQFSGVVTDGNNQVAILDMNISGNFFPLIGDSGDFDMAFSGAVSGKDYDTAVLDIPFSGAVSGCPQDTYTFETSFTGNFPVVLNESTIWENRYSGNFQGGLYDTCTFETTFSGNFVRKDKDTMSISVIFSQVSYNVAGAALTMNTGDSMSLGVVFTSVTYRPN